jgi:predicted nucleic acid-binding protein
VSELALLDTSVWARIWDRRIDGRAADGIRGAVARGEIAITQPLTLEIRYSARDAGDFSRLADELAALPQLELDTSAADRALRAQAQLAAKPGVSHRVAIVDLLIAAVAERHGAAVIHYDADFDAIAQHTDLAFESRWAVERGSAV